MSRAIDGERLDVSGWLGQCDRSRGVRPLSGEQSLRLWVQAQLPLLTVSLMLDVDRGGRPTMLDGVMLPEKGVGDRIVAVEHDLAFTADLVVTPGARWRSGPRAVSGSTSRWTGPWGGGLLSGGGYGG